MVCVGAIAGWFYDKRAERRANPEGIKRLGVLLASGMLVGEGIIGVFIAALVAFSGKDFPLSLVSDGFAAHTAEILGTIMFVLTIAMLYRWASRLRP
jgi:hypothetical protein